MFAEPMKLVGPLWTHLRSGPLEVVVGKRGVGHIPYALYKQIVVCTHWLGAGALARRATLRPSSLDSRFSRGNVVELIHHVVEGATNMSIYRHI